ncbi:MAG: DUF3800 domain-containing protein [Bacteroidaceae bacterium]|nr:DUF3800 domain-containing protein [Bacteroidaceae bacterium]MEA5099498.1 DUF3800 domain-containing protein [Bacteroidales bacterium]
MSRKLAFIDEYGAFGFKFDNLGNSTHFIITAVIIDDEKKEELEIQLENIRKKYFQDSEMKSKLIGNNHRRRNIILAEILKLDFKLLVFIADKEKIGEQSGLRFKEPFYKFLNNYVREELMLSFKQITIYADETGDNEFIISFSKYMKSKIIPSTLFGDSDMQFCDSKKSLLIQLADIISGSLAYNVDKNKIEKSEDKDYFKLLNKKNLKIISFPKTYETFDINDSGISTNYNKELAELCYRRAYRFIENNRTKIEEDVKQQVIILQYLLFRFMNNDKRNYIPTIELINHLSNFGYSKISTQTFRNKIIGKLRDAEVIISSSSYGYKIPTSEKDLLDFFNHDKSIIIPMLSRLKKCNDTIKLGTEGRIDLYEKADIGKIIDYIK